MSTYQYITLRISEIQIENFYIDFKEFVRNTRQINEILEINTSQNLIGEEIKGFICIEWDSFESQQYFSNSQYFQNFTDAWDRESRRNIEQELGNTKTRRLADSQKSFSYKEEYQTSYFTKIYSWICSIVLSKTFTFILTFFIGVTLAILFLFSR